MVAMTDFDFIRHAHNTDGLGQYLHPIHKFGHNPALSNTAYESVWTAGGLYPWSAFDAGGQNIFAKSDDGADTGLLTIEGLDANYIKQVETKAMTGATAVQFDNTFRRVHRMSYVGSANAGTITAHTVSGTGTVVAQIAEGIGQTQMAVYTIPAGYVGYLLNYTSSTGKNDDATVNLYCREEGETFQLKSEIKVFQNSFTQSLYTGLRVPAKTDIDLQAITTSAGSEIICNFDLIISGEDPA